MPSQWMNTVMQQLKVGKQSNKDFSLSDAMKKAKPLHAAWKQNNSSNMSGGDTQSGGKQKGRSKKVKKCIQICLNKTKKNKRRRWKRGKKNDSVAVDESSMSISEQETEPEEPAPEPEEPESAPEEPEEPESAPEEEAEEEEEESAKNEGSTEKEEFSLSKPEENKEKEVGGKKSKKRHGGEKSKKQNSGGKSKKSKKQKNGKK